MPGAIFDRPHVALAAALASALLLVLAFPAADLGPLAFVALVPLLLAADRRTPLAAARLGLVTGLAFFLLHATWIAQIGSERSAGVLALVALTALESLFVAAFAALVPASRRASLGWARLPLLAATWAALELLRAEAPLGGFAWGLLGLTQHGGGPLLPAARVVGVYGLSALIAGSNLALAAAVQAAMARRVIPAAALVAVAAILPLTGLAAPAPPAPDGPAERLLVVQGSVPFDRSNRGLTTRAVFQRHVDMTTAAAASGLRPDLVVWGEGAADDDPLRTPVVAAGVEAATTAIGAPLLLGATTAQGGGRYATEGLLFTPSGRLADRYTKRRLVPFGEYVPASGLMRRLVPATNQLPYDKVPGTSLKPMLLDGTSFGVLICYETAYPQDSRSLAREGARFVVVLANNASFGHSPLARQHLATSQLRAVEEGRTVVHAAISGLSGVVGPDGRVRAETGLYERTAFSAEVQPRSGLTLYARFGRLVEAVLVGAAVALVVAVAIALAAPWASRRRGANQARGDTNEAAPAPAGSGTAPAQGASNPASSAHQKGPAPSR